MISNTVTPSIVLTELNALQKYRVHVRANGVAGVSISVAATFRTLAGPPSIIRTETGINADQLPFRFALVFDQPVFEAAPGRLSALNASLEKLAGHLSLPVSTVSIDSADPTIIWISATTPAGVTPSGSWPEGFYELILNEGVLVNAAGQYPGQSSTAAQGDDVLAHGSFLNADLNGDAMINDLDLAILSASYGMTGQTYAHGDLNRDGTVNFDDLVILSQRFNATLAAPPTAPGTLVASASPDASVDARHTIDLQWTAAEGVSIQGFDIFRSTDGSNFTKIDRVAASARSYRDQDLWEGRRYYYRVRSFVTASDGALAYSFSTPRSAATTVLSMPLDLHVTDAGQGKVWIEWDDMATTETTYRVERTTTPDVDTTWTAVMTGNFEAGSKWAEDSDSARRTLLLSRPRRGQPDRVRRRDHRRQHSFAGCQCAIGCDSRSDDSDRSMGL